MANCTMTENYFKERTRMTRPDDSDRCTIPCGSCPFYKFNNGVDIDCHSFEVFHTEKAIAILQKWSDTHPVKTYKEDFFKKFPNASKNALGEPMYCRKNLYEGKASNECHRSGCIDCWNEVIKE